MIQTIISIDGTLDYRKINKIKAVIALSSKARQSKTNMSGILAAEIIIEICS